MSGLALVTVNPEWTREELLTEMLRAVARMRAAAVPSDDTLRLYVADLQRFRMDDISPALLRIARAELLKWEPRFPEIGLFIRAISEEAEHRYLRQEGARFMADRAEWLRQRHTELEGSAQ